MPTTKKASSESLAAQDAGGHKRSSKAKPANEQDKEKENSQEAGAVSSRTKSKSEGMEKDKQKTATRTREGKSQDMTKPKAKTIDTPTNGGNGSGKGQVSSKLYDEKFAKTSLASHASWLSGPITTLSNSAGLSILHSALITASFILFILLIAPRQWAKYISLPVFPLIPALHTLNAIAVDNKSKSRTKGDGAQWLFFWTAWVMLGWVDEMLRVFKPGYTSLWEITRVGLAVGIGGPWLGREAFL